MTTLVQATLICWILESQHGHIHPQKAFSHLSQLNLVPLDLLPLCLRAVVIPCCDGLFIGLSPLDCELPEGEAWYD